MDAASLLRKSPGPPLSIGRLNADPPRELWIEERFPTFDSTRDARCAASLQTLGLGKIAVVYGPIGRIYASNHAAGLRQFCGRIAARLISPLVRVEGPPSLEVVLRTKEGRLLVHLLNLAGMQVGAEYVAGDFIPAIGPVRVGIRTAKPPARPLLEPGARAIAGEWHDGVWTASIPRVEIHEIVSVPAPGA